MRLLVLGNTGLAGSAIVRASQNARLTVRGVASGDIDLTNRENTFHFFENIHVDAVIVAAAKVGGIYANSHFPVDFLSTNLQIQTNVLDACHKTGINRLVFLGSSCIYPKDSLQPIKEEYLMTGPLERTNSAYAVAKIAGIELIQAYRRQFGHRWISLMPTNLYGPEDNFDLNNSHVLPALIRRFVDAADAGIDAVTLWGSGKPKREFLHADDFARGVLLALEEYDDDQPLNIGSGKDYSIKELSTLVSKAAGFIGEINWDRNQPDGVSRKLLDSSRLSRLGFRPRISLSEGISMTIDWYRKNRSHIKGVN